MEFKTEFGSCRFCQSQGQHRDITKEYSVNGKRENCSDVVLECFNIFISTSVSRSALICAQCVENLQAARAFRELVLRAEQGLTAINTCSKPRKVVRKKPVAVELAPVKTEPSDDVDIVERDVIVDVKQESDTELLVEAKPAKRVQRKLNRVVLYRCNSKTEPDSTKLPQAQDTPVITESTKMAVSRTLCKFRCVFCGQVFSVLSALSTHQKLAHKVGRQSKLVA